MTAVSATNSRWRRSAKVRISGRWDSDAASSLTAGE